MVEMEDIFKEISAKCFYGKKKCAVPPDPDISDGSETSDDEELVRIVEGGNSSLTSGKKIFVHYCKHNTKEYVHSFRRLKFRE